MGLGVKPPPPFGGLPVGSVVEQRHDGRTFLVVQETEGRRSTIESWEDGLEVTNRLLRRARKSLEEMNADVSALNKRLTKGVRNIDAKIKSNQRLLDRLIKGHT
jgi:aminoglycoside phosphotransferase